jgi:serine/threonine-protein kinase HipA
VTLQVSLYGHTIGELTWRNGIAVLDWDAYAGPWRRDARTLSASLPILRDAADQADNFFGGLLPEGIWRDRLAREVGESVDDVVGLLKHVGGDLAGALVVGTGRAAGEPQTLSTVQVRELLTSARGFLVGGGGSALSGFQRKVALTREGDDWLRGNGSMPTTHILKPVDDDRRAAAHAEHYTLALARHAGLSDFESSVADIDGVTTLVVERYDRRLVDGRVERIHQEDLAQALNLPWRGDAKFERYDPRASLRSIASLLDLDRDVFSGTESDRERLLKYATFNVAVGNTDAHAKNFSILRFEDGGSRLAPLYDAAPIALTYEGRKSMAMTIGGESVAAELTRNHLVAEGRSWGLREGTARALVDQTLERIAVAVSEVASNDSIAATVPAFVRLQTRNLQEGRPARIDSAIPLGLLPRIETPEPRR